MSQLFNRCSIQTGTDKIIPLNLSLKRQMWIMYKALGVKISVAFSCHVYRHMHQWQHVISQVRVTLFHWELLPETDALTKNKLLVFKNGTNLCPWKLQACHCYFSLKRPSRKKQNPVLHPNTTTGKLNTHHGECHDLSCPK